MHAIFFFLFLTVHATGLAMDTPEKKILEPKVWKHLPIDMQDKVLITHFINTFMSPEYTPNINIHIRNMRTVNKKYRNFIQKPEMMFHIFERLKPVNKDIQNIFTLDPESALLKAARASNIPAINLFLIYNQVPRRLSLLLQHWDLTLPNWHSHLESILEENLFREDELIDAIMTERQKEQKKGEPKFIPLLLNHGAPIEKVSFIAELKPECRQPDQIQHVSQIITDHLQKHIIWLFISDIYQRMLPITTAPLLHLAVGNSTVTKQLLECGIDASITHNRTSPLRCNIIQKHNKCVALLFEYITPNHSHLVDAVFAQNTFAVELILKKNKNMSDLELKPVLVATINRPHQEAIKPLLEYIKDRQIKFNLFVTLKRKMMEYRRLQESTRSKKTKNPIKGILAIFCEHLGVSLSQTIKDIDNEIEAYDD